MKKITVLAIMFLLTMSNIYSQSKWTKIEKKSIENLKKVYRNTLPKEFTIFQLDLVSFKNSLLNAPLRSSLVGKSNLIIELPNAEGNLEHFRVMETPIMEDGLAAKFPMIKSYAAQGIENSTAVARFSITQFGLHSMTLASEKSTLFIDPYTTDKLNYIVYSKSSLDVNNIDFSCLTNEEKTPNNDKKSFSRDADDKKLRTYRLAQSCTAEYGNIFAGTGTDVQKKTNIQAQMAITMTRVNGIYENDLSITMIFIANNDLLIYYGDTSLDPWSGEYNTKTGQTIDANVGFANYDIGHNFNTSDGGSAGCIGCICGPNMVPSSGEHKGTGMTGRANPTGDPFDIDYVAHEMGHQFGGFHTQSSSGCRSGNGQTEVEPGSGSTVMGYAGICNTNVQNASDAYFAYVNVRDISENVKNGISSSCAQITRISNNPPTVNAGRDYVIPKSTAFVLTSEGNDPDGDAITYSWEQNDPESPSSTAAPTATRIAGPNFRSLISTTSNKRYFPKLSTVLSGLTTNTWEAVPSVARNLNFSVLVRDNHAGGGQTASDLMKVTVKSTAGPFVMTSPNTNVSWAAGTNQTVTWNVAGTDANGVDAKYVDIYLSTNGGTDFTTLLASQVPNDGTEFITIPNVVGTQNRIMVKGFDNIFYDLSNADFAITAPESTFAPSFSGIAGEQTKLICSAADINYNIKIENLNSFANNISFAATGLPIGATATFSPTSTNVNGIVVMTVSLPITTLAGFYAIEVTASSGAISKIIPFYLGIGIGTTILSAPINNAIDQNTTLDLTWGFATNATSYNVEVATTSDFSNIISSGNVVTNSYTVSGLLENTDYFWRVKAKNAICSEILLKSTNQNSSPSSTVFSFKTGVFYCYSFPSTGSPIAISASGSPTINSIIPISGNFVLSDINVTMKINHTYVNDLTATLISPTGTQIKLFDRPCTDDAIPNINGTFDDAGIALICGTNPGISGTVKSKENLTAFNGQNATGNWTLRIKDNAGGDGGSLVNWSMNMCSLTNMTLAINENKFENFDLYPNPNNGSFNIQLQADANNKIEIEVNDISGRQIFNKSFENQSVFNENINLDTIATGIYLVTIKNGKKIETRKIIVN